MSIVSASTSPVHLIDFFLNYQQLLSPCHERHSPAVDVLQPALPAPSPAPTQFCVGVVLDFGAISEHHGGSLSSHCCFCLRSFLPPRDKAWLIVHMRAAVPTNTSKKTQRRRTCCSPCSPCLRPAPRPPSCSFSPLWCPPAPCRLQRAIALVPHHAVAPSPPMSPPPPLQPSCLFVPKMPHAACAYSDAVAFDSIVSRR